MKKNHKGYFIVLEGTDGSGKATQLKLLINKLRKLEHNVKQVDFPQYGKPSAYFVEQYLNGNYGGIKDVGPYQASLFYALDRYEASKQIRSWLKDGNIVICNRYVLSSAGHQGGKVKNLKARMKFWDWLFNLEYKILGIPQPDLNILLHMPAAVAQQLVDKKSARAYIKGKKRDLHESNIKHLQDSEKVYLQLVKKLHLPTIECYINKSLLTPNQIHNKILKVVKTKIIKKY